MPGTRICSDDKVYALQEDDALISNLEGSFSNVVGLPLELFERMLRDLLTTQLLLQIKP